MYLTPGCLLLHLQEAKGTISGLEDRVHAIEERKGEKRVRKEQDSLILQWETCDRSAQGMQALYPDSLLMADFFEPGLNDFIKDTVMNPKDEEAEDEEDEEAEDEEAKVKEDLSGAKVIWGEGNQYQYRAHLIYYFHQVAPLLTKH